MTRALVYVGMTRARQSNRAYVVTHETATEMHEPMVKQTTQDVLETVLDQEGTERSAHEAMREELDNATRLDRLVPIHEHLCQIAAAQRYETAIDSSGLDPADRAELQASSAYGPLLAALRRGEGAGLDVSQMLLRAVSQSSLNNAKDLAAVVHARVERIVSRSERRSGRHLNLVAGLVPPSEHITDPTLVTPLRELEALISQRADWLAEHAATEDQPWYQTVQQSLSNASPSYRQTCTRDIAAYRERYGVRTQEALGTEPSPTAYTQQRDRTRLAKMIRATQSADDATPPVAVDNYPQPPLPP
jgi:hypothetical protein